MTLYKNKYRIETTRLHNWDYTSDGRYFITICTKNRAPFLGKIEKGKMILNEYGLIVEKCWFDLINHYHNLRLDAFVIMPNHIHGIMIIDNSDDPYHYLNSSNKNTSPNPFPPISPSAPLDSKQPQSRHGIFEFVRALKTFSSRRMNEIDNTPGISRWQSRFHDHIIRDEQDFQRIQQYIINNPIRWVNDSFNKDKKRYQT